MMAFNVSYVYQITDRYSSKLAKIRRATDKFKGSAKRSQLGARNFSNKVSGMQTNVAALAGIIGGAATIGNFNRFETSMNKLNAVTLANSEQMSRMRNTAKNLGATTQFSAGQAAQGMTFLAMAGLDTNQVLQAIPGTLQLAAAGGLDLASAADIATNVLAQMGMEVKDLTKVNDVLSLVQAKANTDVLQAAEALKNVGSTASSLNVSLAETTSLIGAMANAGTKGGEAGTLLRNAMLRLVNPSKKAQKTFRKLGIDMRQFVTPEGKIKDFTKLIDLLGKKNASTADLFKIFEERGGRAILNLQKIGTPAIDKLTAALGKAGGTADKMAKIQMKGLPGVIKTIVSVLEALNIAVFESGLDQFLITIGGDIINMIRWVSRLNPVILKMVAALGMVTIVGGPLLVIAGAIAAAIGAISAPVLVVIGVIAALSAAFIFLRLNWQKVMEVVGGTIGEMIAIIERGVNKVTGFIGAIKGFFSGDKFVDNRVAANNAAANSGTLNGNIQVSAGPGSKVDRTEMVTDMPGNLGMNMAGVR
jgi:TP901 family phage tail tape measure protein